MDVEAIEDWLYDTCIKFSVNSGVEWLLKHSLGRLAANRIREEYLKQYGEPWSLPFPRPEETRHIVDWIVADFADGAPWLGNVDDKGRPKKLMKCSSYEDLLFEADKAMDRKFGRMAKALGPADEQTVMELANGYTVVQLLTPEALDLESERMHHCVGHGAYDSVLKEGSSKFYSLRNCKRRPVVTIEVYAAFGFEVLMVMDDLDEDAEPVWGIAQIQGRRNETPSEEHMKILRPFAVREDWGGRKGYWPTITDIDGVEHYFGEIPDGTVVDKLFVKDTDRGCLPPGMIVRGDAYIGKFVDQLPENLTVGGNLMLSTNRMLVLPESLQVGGEVRVWHETAIATPIPAHLAPKLRAASAGILKTLTGEYGAYMDDIFDAPLGSEDRMILNRMIGDTEEVDQIAALTFMDEIEEDDQSPHP